MFRATLGITDDSTAGTTVPSGTEAASGQLFINPRYDAPALATIQSSTGHLEYRSPDRVKLDGATPTCEEWRKC